MATDVMLAPESTLASPQRDESRSGFGAAHSAATNMPALMRTMQTREDLFHLFFHLLWMKQSPGGRQHVLEGVSIPDTVLINHSRPIHWYFTSKDGTIKMKLKKNLGSKAIIEHFSAKNRASISGAAYSLVTKLARGADEIVDIQAGSSAQLQSALADGSTSGILQNFVDPKAESTAACHNFIISANWTPNVLYLEKRVNQLDVRQDGPSRAHTLEERAMLSEASRFVQVQPLVSTHTTQTMERLCSTIAKHIEALHGVTVSNLVIHVKIDDSNRPWVLYCSSLRVMHMTPDHTPVSVTLAAVAAASGANAGRSRSAHAGPVRGGQSSSTSFGGTHHDDTATLEGTTGDARSSVVRVGRHRPSGHSACTRRAGNGGVLLPRGSRASQHASATEEEDAAREGDGLPCVLCSDVVAGERLSFLARQHVLFPLTVVAFFNTHAPGTLFSDQPEAGVVPSAFLLLEPRASWGRFQQLRHDPAWLDGRIPLCDTCAAGLEAITSNLKVDEDGGIRVPAGGHPLGGASGAVRPVPTANATQRRLAALGQSKEKRATVTASHSNSGKPPPSQQAPSLPPLAPARRRSPTPL